jgi:PTS system nitrogen regulatory IIA component
MSVKDAAALLKVSEKTVYRWIRQGVIPTYRFQGQYRFDRRELESWAHQKRIGYGTGPSLLDTGGTETVDPIAAMRRGGIHYKIEGDAPEAIYRNIVDLFPFAPHLTQEHRDRLVATLIERELLHSTGIGHGVAVPHPRHPQDWGLGDPVVGIFFLERPVDFKALDGKPVYVLFVLLCATVKGHLSMLSHVSHLLNDAEMRAFLRSQPNRSDLMERIQNALGSRIAAASGSATAAS